MFLCTLGRTTLPRSRRRQWRVLGLAKLLLTCIRCSTGTTKHDEAKIQVTQILRIYVSTLKVAIAVAEARK